MEYKPGKVERTKVRLGDAVISLLAEMPLERVTADAIAERAGMGRATWFRHFTNKSDAVECAIIAQWMRWAASENPTFDLRADLLPFLRLYHSQRETISLLYRRGLRQTVLDASARIADAFTGEGHSGYRERFFLYGFVGILDEWVEREFAETPEEVAAMLAGINGLM